MHWLGLTIYFQEPGHATATEAKATQAEKLLPSKYTRRKHIEGLQMKVLSPLFTGKQRQSSAAAG